MHSLALDFHNALLYLPLVPQPNGCRSSDMALPRVARRRQGMSQRLMVSALRTMSVYVSGWISIASCLLEQRGDKGVPGSGWGGRGPPSHERWGDGALLAKQEKE